jgi:hypothetical protein
MMEGTIPVLLYRPCALRDDDVLPVQDLSHFLGAQSGGGEIPVSVQVFVTVSPEPRKIETYMD